MFRPLVLAAGPLLQPASFLPTPQTVSLSLSGLLHSYSPLKTRQHSDVQVSLCLLGVSATLHTEVTAAGLDRKLQKVYIQRDHIPALQLFLVLVDLRL